MAKTMKILCVHGVGHGEADPNLEPSWTEAITQAVARWSPNAQPQLDFLHYDDYFQNAESNLATYAGAVSKLLMSGIVHGIGDLYTRSRDFFDFPEQVKWTAGMVAQWTADEKLRARTRKALLDKVGDDSYDLVCAHSLGSLICYDTFRQNAAAIKGSIFVSFGSQIGNPFVRDVFAGRVEPLDAKMWFHLFNPDDHVLTAQLNIAAENFSQVITEFDIPNDIINHDAAHYLAHANASNTVWRQAAGASLGKAVSRGIKAFSAAGAKPTRRALLIGINDYPDPANRLDGCVNDVFLMSQLLQESTFRPEEIRVVLDERATAKGIMDRLHWLLDGAKAGDERVLFYSGHGAQIPAYGSQDEVDHIDECLVPYDFDWSPEHAIIDKQFVELYSQLPYDSLLVTIFDCCHSGGMSRDGARRVRGISPPDDIRHRAMRWNLELQMWEDRPLTTVNKGLANSREGAAYVGNNGANNRFGRGMELRSLATKEYDRRRKDYGHHGPYLPVIMEACQENQFSYEYRHGVTSYGAYTYSLATVLHQRRSEKINPSFQELNKLVEKQLKDLKYDQMPCLLGPAEIVKQPIPMTMPSKSK
ncbi:MAG: caspase family protein [Chromatiaceae bacterium]